MIRDIKGFVLAFTAIAAMSMIVAGGAQATQLHATGQGESVIHGQQFGEHIFTTNAGTVKCTQATFEGTTPLSTSAHELSVTGTYLGCQGFGQAATIDMNGCKYVLTSTDTAGKTYGGGTVTVDITGCTSGKSIEITTGICRMTVPQQHHISHLIFDNVPQGQTPEDVTATITGSGIKYQADGPLCPSMPTGQQLTNGTYVGHGTFQAWSIESTAQVTKHGHQYNEHTRGAERGLYITP